MPEVICLGELLIDFCTTRPGVTLAEASAFTKSPGGAPANVAVAVRRLGGDSGFVGAVGDDPFGRFLADVLTGEGVNTAGLVRLENARTPLAFAARQMDGTTDFSFYHDGGLAPLRAEHVDESRLARASALHFGSISRIDPRARAATDKARRLAATHGLLVSYDPNYRRRLWPDADEARRRILEGFEGATVAKLSMDEWAFVLGTDDFRRGSRELLDAGVQLVVRSEGSGGACFATAKFAGHVRAFRVESVDFTGAGDAFDGSLLVDLLACGADGIAPGDLDRDRLERTIRRANAVGALTTTRLGAIPALPRREEVDEFLRSARRAGG